ncbi:MAG: substrate-binding domain-containing protein [Capsulimonadaceae bacterium]|nr:substrate-binding domain-containing protein [Capsulimonadaceae bacterium]
MNTHSIKAARGGIAPVPMYDRIAEDLRDRLQRSEWAQGEKLPGRARLAKEYGVDLSTLQRAILLLLSEGLLTADSRRGTFVAHDNGGPARQPEMRDAPKDVEAHGAVVAVIGHVAPDVKEWSIPSRFWLPAIQSVETHLSAEGFTIQFYNRYMTGDEYRPILEVLQRALADGVAAVALLGAGDEDRDLNAVVDALHAAGCPNVFVGIGELDYDIDQVYFNHRRLGFLAAQRLLRAGHERIVFLATHDIPWMRVRAEGARDAFRQFGVINGSLDVLPAIPPPKDEEFDPQQAAYEIGRRMIESHEPFTAVIAANDFIACGFVRATTEANILPGVDYNIIGFDDDESARLVSLSTFRPPLAAMGTEAARVLSAALKGNAARTRIELSPSFIARSSTNPLKGIAPRVLKYHRPEEALASVR